MSPRHPYAGIVVGGSRDGQMISGSVPELRIQRPRRGADGVQDRVRAPVAGR